MKKNIKIAIIGCGQISDAHLSEISLINNAQIVAVCDAVNTLAEDTANRYKIPNVYTKYEQMLEETNPDVVHITTPPHTHLSISTYVLEHGCHVYIEKPFGINLEEAKKIINTAVSNKLIACAGFSQMFDIVSIRVKELIDMDFIGEVVHVETYYGDSLDGSFSKIFLKNEDHWIHQLPGKMFHNVISHALYHILPFLSNKIEQISCIAQDWSNNGVFNDELRVMILSGKTTGFLTYTNSVKPVTQYFRLYGTKAIIHVDLSNHAISIVDSTTLPGPLSRVRNTIVPGKRLINEGFLNFRNFISGKDRFFAGMGGLFEKLYENITLKQYQSPIPYSIVLKHAEIMDEIARQCELRP